MINRQQSNEGPSIEAVTQQRNEQTNTITDSHATYTKLLVSTANIVKPNSNPSLQAGRNEFIQRLCKQPKYNIQ